MFAPARRQIARTVAPSNPFAANSSPAASSSLDRVASTCDIVPLGLKRWLQTIVSNGRFNQLYGFLESGQGGIPKKLAFRRRPVVDIRVLSGAVGEPVLTARRR